MNEPETKELFYMIKAIYHHLGLDGKRPLSINHIKEDVQKNILKWQSKKINRQGHERETPTR